MVTRFRTPPNDDSSGILRVPVAMSKSNLITPDIAMPDLAKRQLKADMNEEYYGYSLMMKLKADPGDQEINLSVDTGSLATWTNPDCSKAGAFADICQKLNVYKPQGEPLPNSVNGSLRGRRSYLRDVPYKHKARR